MQPELNDSTLRIYKSLIALASAGFKLKLNTVSASHDLEPMFMLGHIEPSASYIFNITFYLHDEVFINPYTREKEYPSEVNVEIITYDLNIDWKYLNENIFGYEVVNNEEWHSKIIKEMS